MGTNATTRKGTGRATKPKPATRTRWPYRFAMVPLDRLFVDADYQRPLTSFVEEVARDYDPAKVGTLLVSERDDGRYAVFDGQTRMEAMRQNGEPEAPCLIYSGLTPENEAQLFADLVTKRRGTATFLRFRAELRAGKPEAVAIAQIVEAAGLDLGLVEKPTTVRAVAALEYVYRRDPQLLPLVLGVIVQAWPDPKTDARLTGDIIRGLATFLQRESSVQHETLVERLAGVTPMMIRHRANALKEGSGSGGGSPGYVADAILGIYMRGGKTRVASAA
jgi:hypothetical protein